MPEQEVELEEILRDWQDLMFRLQQLTRNDQGASILHIDFVAVRGRPKWWSIDKRKVEPATSAAQFAKHLRGFDGIETA